MKKGASLSQPGKSGGKGLTAKTFKGGISNSTFKDAIMKKGSY